MFQIGGSLAEVSDQKGELLGLSFEAGGAFGGFVLVFWLSPRLLERLRRSYSGDQTVNLKIPINDRLPLSDFPSRFTRAQQYACKYSLFNTQTGDVREFQAEYTWEAGHLTVYVRNVGENDMIMVEVEDGNTSWSSENFDWRTRETLVKQV